MPSGLLLDDARSFRAARRDTRMAPTTPALTAPPDRSAIPPALFNACFVLFIINAAFFPTAWFAHWWIYNSAGHGIPTDFVNVWAAGRLVLDGPPALAYDWDIQKKVEPRSARAGFCRLFRLALSAAIPVRGGVPCTVSLRRRLHWLDGDQHRALSRRRQGHRRTPLRADCSRSPCRWRSAIR